jgi:transposase InsO family protein
VHCTKQKSYGYRERDEIKRQEFQEKLKAKAKAQIVYIDEARIDNRDLFKMWLEKYLLPKLKPGDIIVIDNASFHKSQAIEDLIAQFGCELLYLPPYSPDFNPIENWWFVLKNWMRQLWDEFDNFHDCVDAAFAAYPNISA